MATLTGKIDRFGVALVVVCDAGHSTRTSVYLHGDDAMSFVASVADMAENLNGVGTSWEDALRRVADDYAGTVVNMSEFQCGECVAIGTIARHQSYIDTMLNDCDSALAGYVGVGTVIDALHKLELAIAGLQNA